MLKFFRRSPKQENLDKKLVFSLSRARIPRLAQFKFLPKILDVRERWILRLALAVLLFAIIAATVGLLQAQVNTIPRYGGAYKEAMVGTPQLINPVLATSDIDKDIARLIYAGLLKYNEQGELIGDLAEKFTTDAQGQSIKFTLRKNLFWHDGVSISPDDVKFTIETITNPAWHSPLWRGFQDVEVSVTGQDVILASSKAFRPDFLHLFTIGIIPKHIWENIGPNTARLAVWNIKPVGSGPYKFKALTKNNDGVLESYRLVRYDNYYQGKPFIKEIVLQFFSDFESALAAFKAHTVDGVCLVPERLRSKIPTSGARVIKARFPRFTTLFFQDRRVEALRETAVRQALQTSLDKKQIAGLVPDAEPLSTPFIRDQIGFEQPGEAPMGDIEKASDILKNAGWKQGQDGWIKNKKTLELTITAQDEPIYLLVAGQIKQTWEKLGIKVKMEAVSKFAFEREVLDPRDFDVLLFSIITGSDPDPYPFWHSSQNTDPGLALSNIKSRAIDAALEKARSTPDTASRSRYYSEFQKLLQQDAPGIVLYSSPYVFVVSRRARGVNIEQMNVPADRFNGVNGWFVKSRPGWN